MFRNSRLAFTTALFCAPALSMAASIAIVDAVTEGDPSQVEVAAGSGSFDVAVVYSGSVANLRGIDLRLVSQESTTAFRFSERSYVAPMDEFIIENEYLVGVDCNPTCTFNPGDGFLEGIHPDLDPIVNKNAGALSATGITGSSGSLLTLRVDYTGLAPGDYHLQVVGNDPDGVTLPSWSDSSFNDNDFEVGAAYTVHVGAVTAPTLASIQSRRTHGGAGEFNIDVPLAGPAPIEMRAGNLGSPQLVFNFSGPVEAVDGSLTCNDEVVVTGATCGVLTVSGNALIVNYTTSSLNVCVTVALSGLRGAGGGSAVANGSGSVRLHVGNSRADVTPSVNLLDMNQQKGRLFQAISAENVADDIRTDGLINLLDLNLTKGNLFQAAPSCQ